MTENFNNKRSGGPIRLEDFNYRLPPELIAQYPLAERSASRLLALNSEGAIAADTQFSNLTDFVSAGDLLVFNDTSVIPARLLGQKQSGGKIEVLVERVLDTHTLLAQIRASKAPKAGSRLLLEGEIDVEVMGREDRFFVLRFDDERSVIDILDEVGHMPLPPYIERSDEEADLSRYQTVFARHKGAVAAPTAGLHFDEALLARLDAMGVQQAYVTLHVGAGTFLPVREADITQHKMHSETVTISQAVCDQIKQTQKAGGRVIAVGTTVARTLETASQSGELAPFSGETDIFIYPGYQFHNLDALITNFHLPESTLLMLVCAFGGQDNIMSAYQGAIKKGYRFYSYGDAMFIPRHCDVSSK